MSYEWQVRPNSDQHSRAVETRHTEEGEGHLHDPPGGRLVVGPGALLPRKEASGGKCSPALLSFRAVLISPCVIFRSLIECYLGFSLDSISDFLLLRTLPSEVAPPET